MTALAMPRLPSEFSKSMGFTCGTRQQAQLEGTSMDQRAGMPLFSAALLEKTRCCNSQRVERHIDDNMCG